jgi:TolB-like protein/DNA-binding winged helix-turn-helix (wHTH) protein/Flp pilus assembly protein TadD
MGRTFRVGHWRVEPDLNRMKCGRRTVSVEPKVAEVLAFMARHPGEVLGRERILGAVWPGVHVGGETLRYSISELRKAFGDDARNPRFIETIPRRGYRLIATVSGGGPSPGGSVAVLAFSDMSAARDQEYFCDGIAEEIIGNLVRIRRLRVAPRTSSFAFKGRSEDARAIGRDLGVDHVLDGSVRREGDRVRIAVQLIRTEDGTTVWSERFDRRPEDIFAVQDEIARSVAAALEIALSPRESLAIGRAPTSDPEAYDFYLRGRQFYYQYRRKGIEFALTMFARAVEIDGGFVRAWAGMADCASFLYMYAGNHERHRRQAEAMSRRALELDPDSAEAHASRGVACALGGDYAEAEEELETAIALDPGLFEAWYSYARVSFARGELAKTVRMYAKAMEVNPHDYQAPLLAAQVYEDLGDADRAREARERGVRAAESRLRLNPDDSRALYMGANAWAALGERDRGLEWARQALAIDPDEPMVLYNVACVQALAGRCDEALDSLERAVRSGLHQKGWLEHDSNLDPLRRSPRYRKLVRDLRC